MQPIVLKRAVMRNIFFLSSLRTNAEDAVAGAICSGGKHASKNLSEIKADITAII